MMTFWLILAVMMAVALACVIAPLWRARDSRAKPWTVAVALYRSGMAELEQDCASGLMPAEHRARAQRELERRLVDEARDPRAPTASQRPGTLMRPVVAALLVALLPAGALVLYMRIGDPVAVAIESTDGAQNVEHMGSPGSLDYVVSRLALRLRNQPNDPAAWAMLARSYVVLERAEDAVAAYRRALALTHAEPELLADYADALATLHGGDLNGEALQSIQAALALDPRNVKALALAGSAALDRRDYRQAMQYWERLKTVADPEIAAQAQRNIETTAALMATARDGQAR
ncbi:c-type cytochrome biogenesis protein CcmI [Paraburkholderia sp. MMS20-SJTN17]|uniref:C-type cytochrome biogenesis protein CcmI n=1 Tax=Paraburkholderia translucens TaxID=2886945 RepID=A0ABS8KKV9_9BURK|nr:c-type cytochrome biogenesis protein CcmI [Paraburkholderia sp. MMS20-SJTN17]MCC8405399.1 c-type cytochrome biogenesis protein CcmI [Paraburkholderia sp. MMS20-SJTN17]